MCPCSQRLMQNSDVKGKWLCLHDICSYSTVRDWIHRLGSRGLQRSVRTNRVTSFWRSLPIAHLTSCLSAVSCGLTAWRHTDTAVRSKGVLCRPLLSWSTWHAPEIGTDAAIRSSTSATYGYHPPQACWTRFRWWSVLASGSCQELFCQHYHTSWAT